jgi:hypothetical protein
LLDERTDARKAVVVWIARSDHLRPLGPFLELEGDGAPHLGPIRLEVGQHDPQIRPFV